MEKTCRKCQQMKPFSEYNKDKRNKDGLYGRCKACHYEATRKWIEGNREQYNALAVKSYHKNRPKNLERMKKYKEENREAISEYNRQYAKDNPEKMHAKGARRRAHKAGAESEPWARVEIFKRDGFTCVYCDFEGTAKQLQVDHIIPLSRGGSDLKVNLATACRPCNISKKARTPEEWRSS